MTCTYGNTLPFDYEDQNGQEENLINEVYNPQTQTYELVDVPYTVEEDYDGF